ncbi:MAG: DUF1343 domain-containing protein [Saprospiraceae bacterium]|nr:DUF1343 domain-containing protein [Saprospiraceae bacterium]
MFKFLLTLKSYLFLVLIIAMYCCAHKVNHGHPEKSHSTPTENPEGKVILPGAYQMDQYLPLLKGKKVGLVINQTSTIGKRLLLDTLLDLKVDVRKIFVPEHGLRGEASAGTSISDGKDSKSGLPIKSLYGKNKKPSAADLADLEVVIFDLQDVGVRFYTYISTLHYVMEACAEHRKDLIVLDRPNPNGFYVDGPVLDTHFRSFVGMHPIPVVYGLTIGELGLMIHGEKWLSKQMSSAPKVILCKNYSHRSRYILPVKPSPNLPNARAILLYPGMCFFEGTLVSLGRGTKAPFQIYGHPMWTKGDTSFVPREMSGATDPPWKDKECFGRSLMNVDLNSLYTSPKVRLNELIEAYRVLGKPADFFSNQKFFDQLVGTDELRIQIIKGKTEKVIRQSWQKKLDSYKKLRVKYLLYKD